MAFNADEFTCCPNGRLRALLRRQIAVEVDNATAVAFKSSVDPSTDTRADILAAAAAHITVTGS